LTTETVEVTNRLGIHARPAAQIVKTASMFESQITITYDGDMVNAKSIMGVMTLAACRGTVLEISADGEDEKEAVAGLLRLVREGFGED
jgi:phosphocarrier protein